MGVKKEEEPDKAVTEDGKVDYRCVASPGASWLPRSWLVMESWLCSDAFLSLVF